MKVLTACLLLSSLLAASRVCAGEDFPGQMELAAGLACHRDLDMACARQRLENALTLFSVDADQDYLAHVSLARMALASIHLSFDDLARAETEFYTLLLIDPDFALPAGDHPPKLRYVLAQARRRLLLQRKPEADKPTPVRQEQAHAESPPSPPAPSAQQEPDPLETAPTNQPMETQALWADLRFVALFGDDAAEVHSGLGASLAWRCWLDRHWGLGLRYAYAYHPLKNPVDGETLQSMALSAEFLGRLPLGSTLLEISLGFGGLGMGTRDRYDHWYASIHSRLALVWPAQGPWALALGLEPSLLLSADESSFFLPIGLAGAWRW